MLDENLRPAPTGGGAAEFGTHELQPAELAKRGVRGVKARTREAVIAGARQQVHYLNQNPEVRGAVGEGRVAVIGAYYELSSGAVDFMQTGEDLRLESDGEGGGG